MKNIRISDPTLRDGNHAVGHQLSVEQIRTYASAAERAGIHIVEVGHGNGLGASSLQVGESLVSDALMLETARECLQNSLLGVMILPGFGTIKDIQTALVRGVDVVRVGCHCTEADTTERHLGYVRDNAKEAIGCLVMSHMATPDRLAEECAKMESYGASTVGILDSAGTFLPADVTERIQAIKSRISVPVFFHGHNNLGLAVANSLAAAQAGAEMIDGCARGFGAGAGNTQLETLVAVLERSGFQTGVDLYRLLDAADIAETQLINEMPGSNSISIMSGLAGVFSGFKKHAEKISNQYGVDVRDIFTELGKRKVLAGQEDIIVEIANELAGKLNTRHKQEQTG